MGAICPYDAPVRAWVIVVACAACAACGRSKATPDAPPPDAPPPDASPFDGTYACATDQLGGDSCSAPLFDPSIQASWTMTMAAGHMTITSTGFDQPAIACDGAWSAGLYTCTATWTRAGRVCTLPLHVQAQANQTMTFWINTVTSQTATCTRQ